MKRDAKRERQGERHRGQGGGERWTNRERERERERGREGERHVYIGGKRDRAKTITHLIKSVILSVYRPYKYYSYSSGLRLELLLIHY